MDEELEEAKKIQKSDDFEAPGYKSQASFSPAPSDTLRTHLSVWHVGWIHLQTWLAIWEEKTLMSL